jgi:hypothetical protein
MLVCSDAHITILKCFLHKLFKDCVGVTNIYWDMKLDSTKPSFQV